MIHLDQHRELAQLVARAAARPFLTSPPVEPGPPSRAEMAQARIDIVAPVLRRHALAQARIAEIARRMPPQLRRTRC